MSPVQQVWRRVSGRGTGKRYRDGTILDLEQDWRDAKRGKVDGICGVEGVYEYLPKYELPASHAFEQSAPMQAGYDHSQAVVSEPDRFRPFPVTQQPMQKSWREQPHELATSWCEQLEPHELETSWDAPRLAVELHAPQNSSENSFSNAQGPRSSIRILPATELAWSAISQATTVYGASPTETRYQTHARPDLMYGESTSHQRKIFSGSSLDQNLAYLDPRLRHVSGRFAPACDDVDPLQTGDDGDAQLLEGLDYRNPDYANMEQTQPRPEHS